ncbi:MAG: hypothetical protein JXB34_13490 [Bacteroidales bacterium]|nr:hypothetical protein [Bacteroidales bacterium]
MNSIILQLAEKYIRWIFLIFSVIVLIRGHNQPGGGFIAGLLAGLAIIFKGFAFTPGHVNPKLENRSQILIGAGILAIALSFIPSVLFGQPFMQGSWFIFSLPAIGSVKAGTPFLFDIGVFLAITGVVFMFFFSLTTPK